MSRIGKLPIPVPGGVTVEVKGDRVEVKGPKGQLSQALVALVDVKVEGTEVHVGRANDSKPARANHGLMRSLLNNMVQGVSQGFEKRLAIEGTGYRAEMKGRNLVMQLGYSHPVEYEVPQGIDVTVDKTNRIAVKGIDKQQVGQVAAVIRGFRKPDAYKGKGVRYEGERLRLKAGKSS